MKMSVDDWDVGGKVKVTLKKGIKLKKQKITYCGHLGQSCEEIWRKCPHGVWHPSDRPYYDSLKNKSPTQIRKLLCRHGCFKVNISL